MRYLPRVLLIVQPLGLLAEAAPQILVKGVLTHAAQEEVLKVISVIKVVFVIQKLKVIFVIRELRVIFVTQVIFVIKAVIFVI